MKKKTKKKEMLSMKAFEGLIYPLGTNIIMCFRIRGFRLSGFPVTIPVLSTHCGFSSTIFGLCD